METIWITAFSIQIVLHKYKVQQTEVILGFYSLLLLTNYKNIWPENLHFPNTFSYLFHNYDITNLKNIHPITFRKYAKHLVKVLFKKSGCSFKNM